jgi:hypothetical protein
MADVLLHARGDWPRGRVRATWVASGFRPPPAVQAEIERVWQAETARLGRHLFDGPLCRLEGWRVDDGGLRLDLSRTSYKPFLGTNGRNAAASARHGDAALANGVGTSAAVVSDDGHLLFGVRGPNLALYPDCAHPFGGCLEPAEDLDVVADMMRELREELGLRERDIADLRCIALGRDLALLQPELTFVALTRLPLARLIERIDAEEHRDSWSLPASPQAVSEALRADRPMTPLTRLTLLSYGGWAFGDDWYRDNAPRLPAGAPGQS